MDSACTPTQIVLAEDNPADVELVREALREHDICCDLRVLSDGAEALRFVDNLAVEAERPNVFLLDLHLPKHDGEEILGRFRSQVNCAQIPVVILTSSDPAWSDHNLRDHPAVHCFQKPMTLTAFLQLGKLVREVLGYP